MVSDWNGLYIIIVVAIVAGGPIFYRIVCKLWPFAPHLIQSLWFIVAGLSIIGAPMAFYLQAFYTHSDYAYWYNAFSSFMIYWLVLVVAAVTVTVTARIFARR